MKPSLEKTVFGKLPDGKTAHLFTLTNANGVVAKITNYGTIITQLHVPDRDGNLGDVVLGFDTLEGYLKGHPYFGATIGRVGNRIANGRFTLEGHTYELAVNNGRNSLHGGKKGFDKVLWKATPLKGSAIEFNHTSPDGDEGYPGKLNVRVVMTLTDADELRIEYLARTNRPTPVNLTNHSYFNLAGSGTILDHEVMIAADFYTPPDASLIPTGEIRQVRGTVMDFTESKVIGSRFKQIKDKPRGYDHNYVLRNSAGALVEAARAYEPKSGRVLEVFTTEPGVQFYTGNFLDGSLTGKGGVVYKQHTGFCLETQHFPDSINQPHFPDVVLWPGEELYSLTIYKFLAESE